MRLSAPELTPACKNNQGYSLLEIMVAIAIIGSVFMSTSSIYRQGNKMLETQREKRVAIMLARQMMEEIMTKDMRDPDIYRDGEGIWQFEENGPGQCYECGNSDLTRADLDDVDDYHGWDSGPDGQIETMDGTPMKEGKVDTLGNPVPDYSQDVYDRSLFRRQVSVVNVTPAPDGSFTDTPPGIDSGFLRVTVMVSSLRDHSPPEPGLAPGFLPVVLSTVINRTYR